MKQASQLQGKSNWHNLF